MAKTKYSEIKTGQINASKLVFFILAAIGSAYMFLTLLQLPPLSLLTLILFNLGAQFPDRKVVGWMPSLRSRQA